MIKKLIALLSILVPASALEAGPYKPDSGPLQVSFEQVSIDAGGRMLSMRIAFPTDGGMYPVVILSHGGGCAGGSYQVVSDHWASHGYMVIQPTHPDSVSVGFDMAALDPRQMEGIVGQRVEDMSLVLDALSDLETMFPSLAGKMDVERLVAVGHSMGGDSPSGDRASSRKSIQQKKDRVIRGPI